MISNGFATENLASDLKLTIHEMDEEQIKELLNERSNHWKQICHKNCIALTKVYDQEADLIEKLKSRVAELESQRDQA